MGFFDLNIPYHVSEEKSSLRSLRLKLSVKAMELGYTGVAYNNTVKGIMSEFNRCSMTLFPISKLTPSSSSFFTAVKFHRQLLNVPVSSPFRQYTRLTVVVDTPSQALAINAANPILRSYDIVSVRPMNQNVFDQACQTFEVDMIAIDFTETLPFRLKQPMVKAAMERGVYFEITYSGLLADVQSRRRMLSNCKMLVDWTRGKNLIFSSAASSVTEIRGPLDVSNLFSLIGINTERARAAVSKNCRALMTNALRKKKFYKEVIKVEEIPMVQQAGVKSSSDAWLKWDPISSGEGDLSLEDLEKSFSICNASSGNVKPVKDLSIPHVNGLMTTDQLCLPNESPIGQDISNIRSTDMEAVEAAVVEISEEHTKNSQLHVQQKHLHDNQGSVCISNIVQEEFICLLNESPNGEDINDFGSTDMEALEADVVEISEENTKNSQLHVERKHLHDNQVSVCISNIDQEEFISLAEEKGLLCGDTTNNFASASLMSEDDSVEKSKDDPISHLPVNQGSGSSDDLVIPSLAEETVMPTDKSPLSSSLESNAASSKTQLPDSLPDSGQNYLTNIEVHASDGDDPSCLESCDLSTKSAIAAKLELPNYEGHVLDNVGDEVTAELHQQPLLASSGPPFVLNNSKLSDTVGEPDKMDSETTYHSLVKCRSGRRKRKHNSPSQPILFPFKRFWSSASLMKRSRK